MRLLGLLRIIEDEFILQEQEEKIRLKQQEGLQRIEKYIADGSKGDLNLQNTYITTLGELESVDGALFMTNTLVKTLGKLKYVKGSLYADGVPLTSLGKLEVCYRTLDLTDTLVKSLGVLELVGGDLYIENTPLKSLGNLKKVNKNMYAEGSTLLNYYTAKQIYEKIDVRGKIYYTFNPDSHR